MSLFFQILNYKITVLYNFILSVNFSEIPKCNYWNLSTLTWFLGSNLEGYWTFKKTKSTKEYIISCWILNLNAQISLMTLLHGYISFTLEKKLYIQKLFIIKMLFSEIIKFHNFQILKDTCAFLKIRFFLFLFYIFYTITTKVITKNIYFRYILVLKFRCK